MVLWGDVHTLINRRPLAEEEGQQQWKLGEIEKFAHVWKLGESAHRVFPLRDMSFCFATMG